jgi:5-methylcytosine-specific restriction endonuclease McrA
LEIALKTKRKRNYRQEYDSYHGKPEQIKNRAARNKARREAGLKKGDPHEIDHIRPLSKGGSNSKKNTKVMSRSTNRHKGGRVQRKH